jgi:hypothetical protein
MKKRIAFMIVFLLATVLTFGQDKWKGFFKPVTYDTPSLKTRAAGQATNTWLFRPVVSLTAVQFTWNKEFKHFKSEEFSAVGGGIGYQHYIDVNNEPYNNFGVSLIVYANTTTADPDQPASISLAGTISALRLVNVGAGYDLGRKVFFLLTGVSYSF